MVSMHFAVLRPYFFPTLVVGDHTEPSTFVIVYTYEQLLELYKGVLLPGARPAIPEELRWRHQGCRARTKVKARRRKFETPVPSSILGNVRLSRVH